MWFNTAMTSFLKEGLTLEVVGPSYHYESSAHGVRPLLELRESGRDLRGYSLSDRVSGKAAALLYVALGISEVKTDLISENALAFLLAHQVKVTYLQKVPAILNHERSDLCPLEKATLPLSSPEEAVGVIIATVKSLQAAAKAA
jgi:hypothetical protein